MKTLIVLAPMLLVGCASQATRENLKLCRWEIASFTMMERSSSALKATAKVRFSNPTAKDAVLDSLWVDVSTPGGPLARLSHGGTLTLAPGKGDSTEIHLEADPAQLGRRTMEMLFSMPDSLLIQGQARVPVFGGMCHTTRNFRTKVPGAVVLGPLSNLLRGGTPSPAVTDTAEVGAPE